EAQTMIAAWMLYTIFVSGLLYAAARAAEFICRAAGVATRFVWAATLCVAIALSSNAARRATTPTTLDTRTRVALGVSPVATVVPLGVWWAVDTGLSRTSMLARFLASSRTAAAIVANAIDASSLVDLPRLDRPLTITAATSAILTFAYVLIAFGRMR